MPRLWTLQNWFWEKKRLLHHNYVQNVKQNDEQEQFATFEQGLESKLWVVFFSQFPFANNKRFPFCKVEIFHFISLQFVLLHFKKYTGPLPVPGPEPRTLMQILKSSFLYEWSFTADFNLQTARDFPFQYIPVWCVLVLSFAYSSLK